MSWLNEYNEVVYTRGATSYNRNVLFTYEDIQKLLSKFDTIFDGLVNFTDQVSSLVLYPFPVKHSVSPNVDYEHIYPCLSVNGIKYGDVRAYNVAGPVYVNMGQFYISPTFNNFADYNGYTSMSVFLPMLGIVDVDINEVINKYLQVRLQIDYYTGKGMYILGVSNNSIQTPNAFNHSPALDTSMRILSTFETDIGIEIPLGTSNIGDIKRNLALTTLKVGASLAFPPATAPLVTSTIATTTYNVTGRSKSKGSRLKQIKGGSETTETVSTRSGGNSRYDISDAFVESISALNNVSLKGTSDRINDSGLTSHMSGKVKVIFKRPKLIPTTQATRHIYGVPLGEVRQLDLVHGYTEVSRIHIEGEGFNTATAKEMDEIANSFISGVILP